MFIFDRLYELITHPVYLVSLLIVLVSAITLHEFGHAWAAHLSGDDTAKNKGRLTLDPLKHLDPIGSIAILLFGFGWGKPVPVNPKNFRRPRRDDIIVAAAGPAMNVALAVVFGLTLRTLGWVHASGASIPDFLVGYADGFLWQGFLINVLLAVFNLIPVGPLDGAHILKGLLPVNTAVKFARFNLRYGWILLLLLLFTPVAGYLFTPVHNVLTTVIIGDSPFVGVAS